MLEHPTPSAPEYSTPFASDYQAPSASEYHVLKNPTSFFIVDPYVFIYVISHQVGLSRWAPFSLKNIEYNPWLSLSL